jgi:hypothetical protein
MMQKATRPNNILPVNFITKIYQTKDKIKGDKQNLLSISRTSKMQTWLSPMQIYNTLL